jgi:hypothetical protein
MLRNLSILLLALLTSLAPAATVSTSFTSATTSVAVPLTGGQNPAMTGTYSITGTFSATLVFQFSTDNVNWTNIGTYTTTQTALTFVVPGLYRWNCTAYTSGTAVAVIYTTPHIYQQQINNQGAVIFQVDDTGVTAVGATPAIIPPGTQEAAFYQGSINNYFELQLQNLSSGSSASTDFTATANDGTASTHYVDFGINGSAGGIAPFTVAHGGYLYSSDNLLDVGAVGATGTVNIDVGATPTAVLNVDYANGVSINDVTTPSKQIRFLPSGATASTILTLSEAQTTSQTLSFPNITGADTVGTLGLAQTVSGAKTFSAITTVSNTTASTTTGTGALVVIGGAGIGGAITGGSTITGTQLISTIATGTSPLSVTSTTNVANLNASSLGGATFASPGSIGGTAAGSGAFTTLTSSGQGTSYTATAVTAGSAAFDAQNGDNSTYSGVVSQMKMEFGQAGKGFAHWLQSGHSGSVGSGNGIRLYLNTGASAGTSTQPGTGNALIFEVNDYGVNITPQTQTANGQALLNVTGTWNNGAQVFVGQKVNITNTASGAGSYLLDLQTASVSKFHVDPTGIITAPGANPAANTFGGPILYGRNNAAADTVGAVGETITGAFSAVAAGLTTATGNVGSVSLTAGKWLVSGKVIIHGGATGLTAGSTMQASCPVGTAATGTSGTTMVQQSALSLLANGLFVMTIDPQVVNISATTSEFLTCNLTYAAGSPVIDGSITAVRLP